jgi:hypothetical protein
MPCDRQFKIITYYLLLVKSGDRQPNCVKTSGKQKLQAINDGDRILMKPMRQGDVILQPTNQIAGKKLPHLTLAEGEVTGHSHRISDGQAELYERDGTLYLRVLSETATLTHEEHKAIKIPQGNWMVNIQREYEPEGWRYVAD